MYDFHFSSKEQANHLHGTRWIVDSLGFRFSMARQIDYFTAGILLMQEIPEGGETNLDSTMWRRIWTQQKHS
jgi:hypothetical protein